MIVFWGAMSLILVTFTAFIVKYPLYYQIFLMSSN